MVKDPLSAPENMTPSSLTLRVLMMASWPTKLLTKVPSGHFHFLILISAEKLCDLLVTAGTGTGKAVFGRVDGEGADRLFVMCQGGHAFAGCQVP